MEKVDHSLKGIYQQYADRLYSYGLQICPDKGLVEDALHEVFLDIHRNMEAFSKAENPRNYLFASLRYKLYKMKKGRLRKWNMSKNMLRKCKMMKSKKRNMSKNKLKKSKDK